MKPKIGRMTTCSECGYESITWGLLKCTKCGGKLEVLAQEKKVEYYSYKEDSHGCPELYIPDGRKRK